MLRSAMVAFAFLISLSFLVTPTFAAPAAGFHIPHLDPDDILCQLPILKKFLCPRQGQNALTRQTVLGIARGTQDPSGAYRFTVKYANSERWQPSTVVSSWNLPYAPRVPKGERKILTFRRTGTPNATVMPLACPQPFTDPSAYTEDCLSMVLYVPPSLTAASSAPTLMW